MSIRNEETELYVYFVDAGDTAMATVFRNGSSHHPQHEFQIIVWKKEHLISQVLPKTWLQTQDELIQKPPEVTNNTTESANHLTVLATTNADENCWA